MNSGQSKATAFVIRTVGDDHEPRRFSTWAPKVVALIGNLPDTLEDRSIVIPMRRRAPEEVLEKLRLEKLEGFVPFQRKAWRWTRDHVEVLRNSDPPVPEKLNDRAADNWRPLFAIADLVSEEWSRMARDAALVLSGGEELENESVGVLLLRDIRTIFERHQSDRLSSELIASELVGMEDRPWPEWYRGKPISPRQIAKKLGPFGIKPKVIRIGGDTPRGYQLADFQDAFRRYLAPDPQQAQHDRNYRVFTENQSATDDDHVADKKAINLNKINNVADVADGDEEIRI